MAEPTHESREIEIDNMCTIEEKREDLANLIPVSKEQKKCTDLEDQRRNALSVIAELTDVIQSAPNKRYYSNCPPTRTLGDISGKGNSLLLEDPPNSDGDTITGWSVATVESGYTHCDYVEEKTNY
ncbi:hypothetical protein OS493_039059, partial [Desmophyllum pertusum]